MALSTLLANNDSDFFSALSPFGGLLSTLTSDRDLANLRPIPINVTETDKSFEITADIPGVDRGDIVLTVDGGVLRIGVNQEEVREEPGVRYHRIERTRRFVERRIRLPDSADPSRITASYDNGETYQMFLRRQNHAPPML